MNRLRVARMLAALVTMGACAACSDMSRTVAPSAQTPTSDAHVRGALSCVVVKAPISMSCQAPDGSATTVVVARSSTRLAPRFVIVSSNDTLVALTFSNFAFDSTTNIFSLNATVQNLMSQPIGTTDGVTTVPLGVDVFFTTLPHATSGTGSVTATNDICCATFTATNQQYYKYTPFIKPDSSRVLTWDLLLASTVGGFGFQVEIDAPVPAEQSVLRWTTLRQGISSSAYQGVWRNTDSDIWAVGTGGTIVHYNGTAWSFAATVAGGSDQLAVFGTSATDAWSVGRGGNVAHFNGTSWTTSGTPGAQYLDGVWESASNNVWAVGGAGTTLNNTGSGWTKVATPTTTLTLRHVWGTDASHIWAVGDSGIILFFNGTTWGKQASGVTTALYGVWGSSATNMYAVGSGGTILQGNGAHWTKLASPTAQFLEAVGGSSATDIWAVGNVGTVLHSNGTTWTAQTPVVGTTLRGVTSGSATSVAIVGDPSTLLNLNGAIFVLSNQSGLPLYSVWSNAAADSLWASSVGTTLLYDGTSWHSFYPNASDTLRGISGVTANNVYTAGSAGDVPQWNGTTWTNRLVRNGYFALQAIQFNTIYAAGKGGQISRQNGATWSQIVSPSRADVEGLFGPTTNNVFFVGANGSILRLTSGSIFTTMTSSTADSLFGVHGQSATDMYAVGQAGTIVHLNGAGLVWTAQTSGTSQSLRAVWEAAAGDVYALGDGGTILHGNGTSWLAMSSPVTTALRGAFGTARTHVYVVGDDGVVLLGTQ